MTGEFRKIRYYAKDALYRNTKIDVDIRAILFREGIKAASSKDALDPSFSIKAATPYQGDSDNKKRSLTDKKKSPYVNRTGLVYDPTAKAGPGKYLKIYVTEQERIDAMQMDNPNPNFGWLDEDGPTNQQYIGPDVKVEKKLILQSPRTGEYEEKGLLGRTIGERNPGGKLGSRAARAFGVIVDALGKFRCPPGTPAANQFTNERGENCFSVSGIAQNMIVDRLIAMASRQNPDTSAIIQSLLQAGASFAEIRDAYKRDGERGLLSVAAEMGVKIDFVGDSYTDASYRRTALSKILERAKQTEGAVARTRAKSAQRKERIRGLLEKYGIEEKEDNSHLEELIKRLEADGVLASGSQIFMGGSPEEHKKTILRNARLTAERWAEYERSVAAGETTALTQWVDALLERERQYHRGSIEGIINKALDRPDVGKKTRIIYKADEKGSNAINRALRGENIYEISIAATPAMSGMPPIPGPGEALLYTATGGSKEEQWAAIAKELSSDERMKAWALSHATDLAATIGNGWEDFGAEVGIHEFNHGIQYEKVVERITERTGKAVEELSSEEIYNAIWEVFDSPELTKEVFGADIYDLAESRLDALAGSYSAGMQQTILGLLEERRRGVREAIGPDGKRRNIDEVIRMETASAAMETITELATLRDMGLIAGTEIDDALEWMNAPHVAPISTPPPTVPSGPTLVTPGSAEPIPAVPTDAPTPARPGSPRPAVPELVDMPIDVKELEEAWGLFEPPSEGRRAPREMDAVRNRRSKVADKILEGTMMDEDVREHAEYIRKQIRSIRNMRVSRDTDKNRTQRERKKILNELIDSLPLTEDELDSLTLGTGPLTDEELEKLEKTSSILANAVNEFRIEAEKARQRYRDYEGVDTRYDYDDRDANYRALDSIDQEIKMYEALAQRVGYFNSSIRDIVDIRNNGPFPVAEDEYVPRPLRGTEEKRPRIVGITDDGLTTIKRAQESVRTPEENSAIDRAVTSPPRTAILLGPDGNQLISVMLDDSEVSRAFSDNGLELPSSTRTVAREIEDTRLIISGIDKSEVRSDVVVEVELEIPNDADEIDIDDTTMARVITDDDYSRGMASRKGLGIAGRIIGSRVVDKILEKSGVDKNNAESIKLAGEMAAAFAVGGPAGIAAILLRRGSRDAALAGLRDAVERGWIQPAMAERLQRMIIDRIAPEGLPQDLKDALEKSKDAVWTPENIDRARDLGDAARERLDSLGDSAREVAGSMRERIRDRFGDDEAPGSTSLFDDPFGPTTPPSTNPFDDRFDTPAPIPSSGAIEREFGTTPTPEPKESLRDRARRLRQRRDKNPEPAPAPPQDWLFGDDTNPFKSLFDPNGYSFKQASIMPSSANRKQKVRIAVPAGSKGAIVGSGDKPDSMMLPPGKLKINKRSEDGSVEAEVVSQLDSDQYLKKVSEKFESMSNNPNYDVRSKAKEVVAYAKKKRTELKVTKYSPPKSAAASKRTLERSQAVIEKMKNAGLDPFAFEVQHPYIQQISDAISVLRTAVDEIINTSEISESVLDLLRENSDTQIIDIISDFAKKAHNSLDTRARIRISANELNSLSRNGGLSNDDKSQSLAKMKRLKLAQIGLANDRYSADVTNVELVSILQTRKIEQSLYNAGTRVGSEEFYDSGRGIEIVLKPENAVRIGYAIMPNKVAPRYISLGEADESAIIEALFGNLSENSEESSKEIANILNAIVELNYEAILGPNNENISAILVGGVMLDDIEHVKIPDSVLGIKGNRVSRNHPLAGETMLSGMMGALGVSKEEIKKFFAADGVIGGGLSPKHVVYALQIEKARKMKESLIGAGIPDVIFTNKDGIDMLSDDTWGQGGFAQDLRGDAFLMDKAQKEIASIIEKMKPKEKRPEQKVGAKQ